MFSSGFHCDRCGKYAAAQSQYDIPKLWSEWLIRRTKGAAGWHKHLCASCTDVLERVIEDARGVEK